MYLLLLTHLQEKNNPLRKGQEREKNAPCQNFADWILWIAASKYFGCFTSSSTGQTSANSINSPLVPVPGSTRNGPVRSNWRSANARNLSACRVLSILHICETPITTRLFVIGRLRLFRASRR